MTLAAFYFPLLPMASLNLTETANSEDLTSLNYFLIVTLCNHHGLNMVFERQINTTQNTQVIIALLNL